MIRIEVFFYAQLKGFFGDQLTLELENLSTIATLLCELEKKNVFAADWLKVSRAASEDAFLAIETELMNGGHYYILPPSSGG